MARHREELEALNRTLQDALVVREQMIQNVSHERRTPLTIRMGYLETLADEAFGPLTSGSSWTTRPSSPHPAARIDSEVGKGTLVTVRLPLARRPGAPPPA